MAHEAQQEFCREVKERFPEFFVNQRVLEMGSRDINGSVRQDFVDCDYIGVDCVAGKGVDVVSLGHDFEDAPNSFDVVCSTEAFEHDPHADQTVPHMLRLLRPGGLFFMTCAGDGRGEHGTARTGKNYGPNAHFYRNVSMSQFLQWLNLDETAFREVFLRHNPVNGDLYFFGIKAGEPAPTKSDP